MYIFRPRGGFLRSGLQHRRYTQGLHDGRWHVPRNAAVWLIESFACDSCSYLLGVAVTPRSSWLGAERKLQVGRLVACLTQDAADIAGKGLAFFSYTICLSPPLPLVQNTRQERSRAASTQL